MPCLHLVQASKSQFVNKVQQCFAVKAQVDSFLDLSRASFTRLTESVHELAANYRWVLAWVCVMLKQPEACFQAALKAPRESGK